MSENKRNGNEQERIRSMEREIAYYKQENARLLSQNEILHETAWNLVRELRELKKKQIH